MACRPVSTAALEKLPKLPPAFYRRPAPALAPALLGKILIRRCGRKKLAGRIIEVEAYCGAKDPASHAWRGPTPRNRSMFGPPGRAYVYFTYGNHHCLNIVCERDGVAGAVLIRALEPLLGVTAMARRRGTPEPRQLLSGPGKICQALDIDRRCDGLSLNSDLLYLVRGTRRPGEALVRTRRIGISRGRSLRYRFILAGNPYLSRR